MKQKIKVEGGKEVEITLTAEQIEVVKRASMNIFERCNTLEGVYQEVKPTDDQLILLSYSGADRKMIGAQAAMIWEIICEALNEGHPNPIWFPVVDRSNGGFAFSRSLCDDWDSYSLVGSRRCLKDENISDFAGRTFLHILKEVLTK